MLESATPGDSTGQGATGLRNVLDVNFTATGLGFLSAWLARRARLIQVKELGPSRATVRVTLPVSTPTRVLIPESRSFMYWGAEHDNPAFQSMFGGSLQTRLLVVHEARSADLLTRITDSYVPDIVCLGAATPVTKGWLEGRDLVPLPDIMTKAELRDWGMAELTFWSNGRGEAALKDSLALFEGFTQRRSQESERVYDVRDLVLCDGFYPVEAEGAYSWAWTGADTVGTLLIPSHGHTRLRITLFLFGATMPLDAQHLDVLVDDRRCQCKFYGTEKIEVTTGPLQDGCAHRVDVRQSRTVPTADGSRQIGYALHKIKVEAL